MRLRAARVFDGERWLAPGEVVVEGERIVSVGTPRPGASDVIDLGDAVVAPGFVDVHAHGGGGASYADDPYSALALHRQHGTTTSIASLVTQSLPDLAGQVERLAPLVAAGELGGIHLEGPWLSERYKGAHPAELLRDPSPDEVATLVDVGRGTVRMVTLAVERAGAMDAVAALAGRGVVVALGHSDCTFEQTRVAIASGVTGATHLFNAMPGLHHREPGPVLALLRDERVWCELIADGVHVHPDLVGWVMDASERIVLVTDAMAAAGCGDGAYRLGDLSVDVVDGVARVAGTTTIAGSTLTLDSAVRTCIAAGVPAGVALRAATVNPAAYLGLEGVGRLAPGCWADAVVLDVAWGVRGVLRRGDWVRRPQPVDSWAPSG